MIQFIKRIKKEQPEVELIVFGETILGWYFNADNTEQYHQEIAEPIPGEITDKLSEVAKSEKVYLSFGITEREGKSVYNSQVILNTDGDIIAVHRKFFARDKTFQTGKKPVTITEIKGLKIGLVICFDIRSNAVRKALMDSNADLIIHSMADDEDPKFFGAGFLSRSFGTWYVTANHFGDEGGRFWNGHMFIAEPSGKLVIKGFNKEQYLYYEAVVKINESSFKKSVRKLILKFSLVIHILLHLKIAFGYVADASKVRRRKRRENRNKKKN